MIRMIRMIRLYFKGGEFDPLLGNHIEFEDREFFCLFLNKVDTQSIKNNE